MLALVEKISIKNSSKATFYYKLKVNSYQSLKQTFDI